MSKISSILLYGCDATLIATRALVLKRAGYSVHLIERFEDIGPSLRRQGYDLFLICHTVSFDDTAAAMKTAEEVQPRLPKLLMAMNPSTCPQGFSYEVASPFDGPRSLIESVGRLIEFSSIPSAMG